MGIFEEIDERRKLKKSGEEFHDSIETAQRTFESQVDSIKAIKGTNGFMEIVSYFEREAEACKAMLLSSKDIEAIKRVQVRYEVVNNFLSFLTSRIDYVKEIVQDDDDYEVEQL